MIFEASLAILKTVFRLRLRGSDACGLFQDAPIFRSFFAGSFQMLVGGAFFITFPVFYRFLSQFGAISGTRLALFGTVSGPFRNPFWGHSGARFWQIPGPVLGPVPVSPRGGRWGTFGSMEMRAQ